MDWMRTCQPEEGTEKSPSTSPCHSKTHQLLTAKLTCILQGIPMMQDDQPNLVAIDHWYNYIECLFLALLLNLAQYRCKYIVTTTTAKIILFKLTIRHSCSLCHRLITYYSFQNFPKFSQSHLILYLIHSLVSVTKQSDCLIRVFELINSFF